MGQFAGRFDVAAGETQCVRAPRRRCSLTQERMVVGNGSGFAAHATLQQRHQIHALLGELIERLARAGRCVRSAHVSSVAGGWLKLDATNRDTALMFERLCL